MRQIRRWEKNSLGKKVYYIYDPFFGISVNNFTTKRTAERALSGAIQAKKIYLKRVQDAQRH